MRQKNYYEGHPRAQAAVDAALGGIGGGIVGGIGGHLLSGGGGFGRSFGALVGALIGAGYAAGRKRSGFTPSQQKAAGRGAVIGQFIPGVGAAGGTFFWTERTKNPTHRWRKNPQDPNLSRLKNSVLR